MEKKDPENRYAYGSADKKGTKRSKECRFNPLITNTTGRITRDNSNGPKTLLFTTPFFLISSQNKPQ